MDGENLNPREKAERHRRGGSIIRDFVYGSMDGIITTFALIAGITGAALAHKEVLILGFARLVADGIGMGLGNFLGTRSEQQFILAERAAEEREVAEDPEEEREEIREIYRKKGFEGALLEQIVAGITADRERWIDTMMREELELQNIDELHPARNGALTFGSFVLAGFLPLLAYFPGVARHIPGTVLDPAFFLAGIATAVMLFVVGAARVFVTGGKFWRAGLEMLGVGAIAASTAYVVGAILGRIIHL